MALFALLLTLSGVLVVLKENGHSGTYTWILSTGCWEGRAPINPDAFLVIGILCVGLIGGFIDIYRVSLLSVDKQSPIESLKLIIIVTISDSLSDSAAKKCKSMWRREEDTFRRRALAEELHTGNGGCRFHRDTFLFYGVRQSALFCRSWLPGSGNPRGILIIIHGQNEHSGRYADFVRQLTSCNFEVYAIDWIGHGGSDGLHGYIPSLDHVVADNGDFLENFKIENPRVPCFFFGHSTGGAVVLKDVIYSLEWESIAIMTRP